MDRAALQGDEPRVDAAAGGVDSDGVAAVAGHPELVARMVFALVGSPWPWRRSSVQRQTAVQRRLQLWRPANGPLRRRRSPADRWHLADYTRCGQRCHRGDYFYVPVRRGVCPFRVQGTSRGPALPGEMGGPGRTGLLGTGPRAMPLRAAPGEKLGAAACAAGTKRNAQPCSRRPLRACGAPASSATHGPARASQPKALATPEALRASLRLIPLLLRGHTGRDDEGRR